ncbi:MAG: hypothetical protein A2051_11130 [Desulfovibrionales bacterium GWA2_65_9]|nr:MAG: hypothetical protein A2051_11130 [Desulfovibrionales bacterium GWA2_65_9]
MTRKILVLACLCLLAACAATRSAPSDPPSQRSTLAAELVSESARTLKELRAATRHQILDYALEDARAVIVLPGVYQAGFYYSVHGGSGVIVARTSDGHWGAPAFVGVGGAGFGLQIGLERQRLVLVVQEQEMLERILESGLNFDVIAKYDVLGVREEAGRGSLTERRPVTAFSDGVGLMVGVAMRGAVLTLNEGLTQAYHGQNQGKAKAVLQGSNAPGIEVFELWGALSANLPKGQIERVRTP